MSSAESNPVIPDDDLAFLESMPLSYELKPDGELVGVIVHDYPLPEGYKPRNADLLVRLPAGFPDAAPDMFWFHPDVLYADGATPQAADQRYEWDGRNWQRWSRHLAIAWRPGIDNLQTYLRLIRTDLENATRGRSMAA